MSRGQLDHVIIRDVEMRVRFIQFTSVGVNGIERQNDSGVEIGRFIERREREVVRVPVPSPGSPRAIQISTA